MSHVRPDGPNRENAGKSAARRSQVRCTTEREGGAEGGRGFMGFRHAEPPWQVSEPPACVHFSSRATTSTANAGRGRTAGKSLCRCVLQRARWPFRHHLQPPHTRAATFRRAELHARYASTQSLGTVHQLGIAVGKGVMLGIGARLC